MNLKLKKIYERSNLEDPKYGKRLNFADWSIKLANFPKKFLVVGDVAYFYLAFPLNIKINHKTVIVKTRYSGKKMTGNDLSVPEFPTLKLEYFFYIII